MKRLLPFFFLLIVGCSDPEVADLVVLDTAVFNSRTRFVEKHRTVVVNDGVISSVISAEDREAPRARNIVEAQGRLLVPGFIDVHHHTADILADSTTGTDGTIANLSMEPDSIDAYRHTFADQYLPYGVTVVREAGGDDRYLALMQAWMSPVAWAPDFYPSGGALVSRANTDVPIAGHTVVEDPSDAVRTVRIYNHAGFRHIKLYWRLRLPEFQAALREARSLGMVPYGHIDYKVVSIREALQLGLRNFEHAHTLAIEVLAQEEIDAVWRHIFEELLPDDHRGAFFLGAMEMYNVLGEDNPRMTALIEEFARTNATLTPTLHAIAGPLGLAFFTPIPVSEFADTSEWTKEQMARARRGYSIMVTYVRRLHEAGVALSLGTDTADPGLSVLSEMLLLHEAGIPMDETLQIATLNSAQALGLEELYGTVEPGRRANFILFDANPLETPDALLGHKTVVKDGVVHSPT